MNLSEELMEQRKRIKKIPRGNTLSDDFSPALFNERLRFLSAEKNARIEHIPQTSIEPCRFYGNAENVIGSAQIPIGIAGPLKVNGDYADGEYYLPMATTEGALITGLNNGCKLLTLAGGVNTKVISDRVHISPVFLVYGLDKMLPVIKWIAANESYLKTEAQKVTQHGELLSIEPKITGEGLILIMFFSTGDASGMNMIVNCCYQVCLAIQKQFGYRFYFKSNYSSDKKSSAFNFIRGYGKEIFAEVTLPKEILEVKNLRVTYEQLIAYRNIGYTAGFHSGMLGANCHVGNTVAGLFLATGQDLGHVIHSQSAIGTINLRDNGDLYCTLTIPNMIVATVGGGTVLPTQRECLDILDCAGEGNAKKLAEIITAAALAGELSIGISLANFSHIQGHETYGRNKPS